MVIIFKKGNTKDLKNYIPICLLSNIYTVLTKALPKRLMKTATRVSWIQKQILNDRHIHIVHLQMEKCREYNIPLSIAFIDYKKAFDSVQTQAVLTSLQEQGIEDVYIVLLKEIYSNSSMTVHLHKESKINIRRGIRQGDTASPKLFTAALESIFRRLTWETKDWMIDGEYLSNLRFNDDKLKCTNTPYEL